MDFNTRFIPGDAVPVAPLDGGDGYDTRSTLNQLLGQGHVRPSTVPRDLSAPCLPADACVLTTKGQVLACDLTPGDVLHTRDHGPRRVLWIYTTNQSEGFAPSKLHIASGVMGNPSELTVLSDQSLVVQHWACEMLFDHSDVLIKAQDLMGRAGVSVTEPAEVPHTFVVLDHHALIHADGIWTECLHPDDVSIHRFGRVLRRQIRRDVPKLRAYGPRAALCLSSQEADLLLDQMRTPSRPAKSVKNCQATRPDLDPRVACHSMASARNRSGSTSTPNAAQ